MIYKCENDPSLQQDDFLVRDRPVSRSSVLMNDEKSYFLFEDGMVKQNHEYLNDKLTSNFCHINRSEKQYTSCHKVTDEAGLSDDGQTRRESEDL